MDQKLIDDLYRARANALDFSKPDIVSSRHKGGFLTARERIEMLLDPGSAVEYGMLSAYSSEAGWIPTNGGVDFVGTVDGQPIVTSSTDYTDHGGGYGAGRLNRLFTIAYEHRWPMVLFVDGGGSRASVPGRAASRAIGLGSPVGRFGLFDGVAEMSGWAPSIAVVSGPSYAGHASLAGFSDFLVVTRGSSIGMGGPPMVEAALGIRLTHQELGGVERQDRIGGSDRLVDNEHEAIEVVKRYLSYYRDQAAGKPSRAAVKIREIVPDDGSPYDMHEVIEAIVDDGTMFELRPNWPGSLITAFARLGGRTIGVLANQPASYNGGAIDQGSADKIARFVEICDAYEYPILALVDTPGCVLKPRRGGDAELPGVTRHHWRPLLAHHHRTVPLFSVQIRKGRDFGPFLMTGIGNTASVPLLRLAWPTVELSADDGLGAHVRERNSFDDVVDPQETRDRIMQVLRLTTRNLARGSKKRPIDTW